MIAIDKNKAMLDYLSKCPEIKQFLRFNAILDKSGAVSVQTVSSSRWQKKYIRDHGIKTYDFAIVSLQPQDSGTTHQNAESMSTVQACLDWVSAQNRARNFPDFGADARVIKIEPLQNVPDIAAVNQSGDTAKYMFQCRVTYEI